MILTILVLLIMLMTWACVVTLSAAITVAILLALIGIALKIFA